MLPLEDQLSVRVHGTETVPNNIVSFAFQSHSINPIRPAKFVMIFKIPKYTYWSINFSPGSSGFSVQSLRPFFSVTTDSEEQPAKKIILNTLSA